MKAPEISVSILSANFINLGKEIKMINNSEADWIHVDVMDGTFVPNISFGMGITKQISKVAKKPLDVHLMIVEPQKYIKEFKESGAALITIHYEACSDLEKTIDEIKTLGIKAGVVLKPDTSIDVLNNIISKLDVVLLMSVYPGFGGQKYIESTYDRIKKLKNLINLKKAHTLIEVDGGIDNNNSKRNSDAGADMLVLGNAIFSNKSPINYISNLKK